ncbi:MAG: hypothetical protein B6244_02775 [Candidatus Cloacimonetes bacterium 4572_55]|nr:MAG: hypothetical protein B6244_02775 [Candidatus Cloacimonetes bacterium 4572_55]
MGRKTQKCEECGGRGYHSKPGDRCQGCSGRGYIIISDGKSNESGGFFVGLIKLIIFIISAYFFWDLFLRDFIAK